MARRRRHRSEYSRAGAGLDPFECNRHQRRATDCRRRHPGRPGSSFPSESALGQSPPTPSGSGTLHSGSRSCVGFRNWINPVAGSRDEARMTLLPRLKRLGPLVCGGLFGLALWFDVPELSSRLDAQAQPEPLGYGAAQAEQGQAAYAEHCASCHGQFLDDGAFAPPVRGIDFQQKWGPLSGEALFTYLSTKMPPERPGALGDKTYAEILAYILQENGAPPGPRDVPADPAAFKGIGPPGWPRVSGGGLAPGVAIPPPPPRTNPIDTLRPVTDAMLTRPPDGEWLSWRRTYAAFG